MLLFKTVPKVEKSSFQKLLKNILSRLEIRDLGTPCLLTSLSIKISATCLTEKGCFQLSKCANLLKRSTTTNIELYPLVLEWVRFVLNQLVTMLLFYYVDKFHKVSHISLRRSSFLSNVALHSFFYKSLGFSNGPPTLNYDTCITKKVREKNSRIAPICLYNIVCCPSTGNLPFLLDHF